MNRSLWLLFYTSSLLIGELRSSRTTQSLDFQELELVKLEQRIGKSESDTSLQNNFKSLQAQFTLLYNENEQVKQQLEETKHLLAQRCQQHLLQLEQIEVPTFSVVSNRELLCFTLDIQPLITYLWIMMLGGGCPSASRCSCQYNIKCTLYLLYCFIYHMNCVSNVNSLDYLTTKGRPDYTVQWTHIPPPFLCGTHIFLALFIPALIG